MDIFFFPPQTPAGAHESLAGKTLWTSSHAQSGLAMFTFHLFAIAPGGESIKAARRATDVRLTSADRRSKSLQLIHTPEVMGMCKWNWPFTSPPRAGQLLTPREWGSSPLAWLDEYKLTYSPSPPSSFALSLYGKRGGTQTEVWGRQRVFAKGGADAEWECVAKEER